MVEDESAIAHGSSSVILDAMHACRYIDRAWRLKIRSDMVLNAQETFFCMDGKTGGIDDLCGAAEPEDLGDFGDFGDFEEADDVWVDAPASAEDTGDGTVADSPAPDETVDVVVGATPEYHTTIVSAAQYEEMVRDELGPVQGSGGFTASFVQLEQQHPEFLAARQGK